MILKRATTPRIGWYGLGSMGLPMATNLQRHLTKNPEEHNLTYYNRTLSAGDSLKELGATPAESLLDLVEKCDVIFTMLSNDKILTETVNTISSSSAAIDKKTFVDCSTVHPDTTAQVSSTLSGLGAVFLSAPVFGGPAVAQTGQLVFALGGPSQTANQIDVRRYIVGVMGKKVIGCGEEAKGASLLKIGGNIITLNLMEAVGEAQVFAERTGLGTAAMEELITESFGAVAGGYSKRLTTGIYAPPLNTRPGFGVSLAIKDADHALSIANKTNTKLPGLELASNNMRAAREYGGECLDSSSMYGVLRMQAGLPFWNGSSRQE
ncbi:NAD(P)-dependent oxidoreductase [Aspergillus mulundensis]|uniref:6-phosphogluconate dehydrogenase family protein n=1 Tax=Aspergillus mulundensis TaxID=1810919 RepID=A0A3D8SWH8_9EURO|nr:Uncharacterized protein DSM5745_02415 [Aspergillus mulundensis]RDW90640.1 Uncharacterized protein DSM5745_02415 [Aspergillus mulundensis]